MGGALYKVGEVKIPPETEEESRTGYSSVEWKIHDILCHPAHTGYYWSDSFEFAGERWSLRIYRASNIEVYLVKQASPRACLVHFRAGLKKANGTRETKELLHNFGEGECYLEVFSTSTSDLQRRMAELAPSGATTIVVSFERQGWPPVSLTNGALEEIAGTEKLSNDLGELLISGEHSDLTVRVEGIDFHLHRAIVGARTPVFSAALTQDMQGNATDVVSIDDCKVEVFRAFLQYVYSGKADKLTVVTVLKLLVLADRYQVDELKSFCFKILKRKLSVSTFCDVATMALTYNKTELFQQATDFFVKDSKKIVKTEKWINFVRDHPTQANELLIKANEKK